MDRSEAAVVLGVTRNAGATEIREAYRRRIRQRHPDVAGEAATTTAARIIEAYALLRSPTAAPPTERAQPAPPPKPAPSPAARTPQPSPPEAVPNEADAVVMIDGETMGFSFPADEVFQLLIDAAYDLGDVVYVDPESNLLEVRVQFVGGPPCSVVLSLQGRADRVEAFVTVESLDGSRPPPTTDVVGTLTRILTDRLGRRRVQ